MMHMAPGRSGKADNDNELDRAGSLLSGDGDWDSLFEDAEQAKLRGCAVLGSFMLCVALFTGGLAFPLVEVKIFPGSNIAVEEVQSVMHMIGLAFSNGQVMVGFIMILCTVGIPMVLLVGMLLVMYENFFAVGFGWDSMLKPATRALVVSLMYISTSYQVVMVFLVMIFTCFFTGFGSQTTLKAGFYFLASYCLASIGLVQIMEFLRIEGGSGDEQGDERTRMEALTGYNLRRRFSSFFPSLPGIKETTSVDAFQVFFFQILLLIMLISGFNQPLLDIRVTYQGVALQRLVLSLHDMMVSLTTAAPFPVVLLFALLVLVIPVVYGFMLVAAGLLETSGKCAGDQEQYYEWALCASKVLRPWVMIDVFSIALVIVVCAVQTEYVTASIPDGSIMRIGRATGDPSEENFLHFLSGMYLIMGAGISAIFLRWMWSSNTRNQVKSQLATKQLCEMQLLQLDPSNLYSNIPVVSQTASRADSHSSTASGGESRITGTVESGLDYEESFITRYVAGKSCRCLVMWTVVCLLLHRLPPQPAFQLQSMNEAFQRSLPMMNSLLLNHAPQTVGNCAYPAAGGVPQPCFDHGILDKSVHGLYRITTEWGSGLKSLSLTNFSVTLTQTLEPSSLEGSAPNILNKYLLTFSGYVAQPQLFLKIEECPKNHTTLEATIGRGLCKPFLDTADACCEPNRHFSVTMGAQCHLGDTGLKNLHVQDVLIDTMTVKPTMWRGNVEVLIADKNISQMAADNFRATIMYYLTQEYIDAPQWMQNNGEKFNLAGFLNRVLRFNAPNQEFHCR